MKKFNYHVVIIERGHSFLDSTVSSSCFVGFELQLFICPAGDSVVSAVITHKTLIKSLIRLSWATILWDCCLTVMVLLSAYHRSHVVVYLVYVKTNLWSFNRLQLVSLLEEQEIIRSSSVVSKSQLSLLSAPLFAFL